ncbi:hypothetical protein A3860_30305 [Niastella vici]|uniref:Uncharacterized protein n=1 Tax=Niastella vici TaxID=1703345 RepID=A0A1V9FUS5_9BACT|nr:hypothetical protein A3860_30305 [Niastella vici]
MAQAPGRRGAGFPLTKLVVPETSLLRIGENWEVQLYEARERSRGICQNDLPAPPNPGPGYPCRTHTVCISVKQIVVMPPSFKQGSIANNTPVAAL